MTVKNSCLSTPSTIDFKVNKLPSTGNVVGADSAITGDIKTYTVTGDSGSIFGWIAFGGVIQGASSGTSVAVKWGNPGSGFVRVRETGINGCFGPLMQQNVVISKKPVNGIEEEKSIHNLKVYPVPATKKITIEFASTKNQKGTLELYNIIGERIIQQQMQISPGMQQLEVPTDNLMSGIYYVSLYGNDFKLNHKIEILK